MKTRSTALICSIALRLSSVLVFAAVTNAEIRKCNGVWTNKPCDSKEERKLPEKHRTPRPTSEIDLDRKKLLIQDLEIRALSTKEEYGVEVGILTERLLCLSLESSLAQCDSAVNEKRKEIEERVLAAVKLRAAKGVVGGGSGSSQGISSQRSTGVTIIQQAGEADKHPHTYRNRDIRRRPTPAVGLRNEQRPTDEDADSVVERGEADGATKRVDAQEPTQAREGEAVR
ncbi:MAG: hypothetical protein EBZ48_03210 [Proteobacteria bacterium]|nr:hypothetical protein [Pseudomonadota bacterium]